MADSDDETKPRPDPTVLTTAQIQREVQHLRELVEARVEALEQRLAAMDKATEAARATIATAVDEAALSARTAVGELDTTVQRQMAAARDLNAAQFVTYRTLLDSQAEKVALALSSADKAEEKASSANEKRFDSVNEFRAQLADQAKTFVGKDEFAATLRSLTEKVDDLKQYRDSNQGLTGQVKALAEEVSSLRDSRSKRTGRDEGIGVSSGALVAGIASLAAFLTVVVIVVNLLTGSP